MSNEDVLAQYRREVTPEEACLALMALARWRKYGLGVPDAYIDVLMALAVEKHAPKREEARHAER